VPQRTVFFEEPPQEHSFIYEIVAPVIILEEQQQQGQHGKEGMPGMWCDARVTHADRVIGLNAECCQPDRFANRCHQASGV
jgi:hypothetical protein